MEGKRNTFTRFCFCLVGLLIFSGCTTTEWRESPPFYRSVQTLLSVENGPSANVYINDRYVGLAPITVPLDYKQEVKKKTRKVSYWVTQPGLALGITLLSFGLYLPFSAIPVDIETVQEPTTIFKDNQFIVRIEAPGYKGWREMVKCLGEYQLGVNPILRVVDETDLENS